MAEKVKKIKKVKKTFKRGRKKDFSVKQSTILNALRNEIMKGYYPPGAQLPTRDDMEKRFRASRVTIQRAFHDLIREGFVVPRGRSGTFISVTPPHLYTYALMFPTNVNLNENPNGFYASLFKEAQYRSSEGPQKLLCYQNIRNMNELRWYQELLTSLRIRQFAGMIMINGLNPFTGSLLDEFKTYPHISLSNTSGLKDSPLVELDKRPFFLKAFERLQVNNRSRVALLCGSEDWSSDMAIFNRYVKDYGFQTQDSWVYHIAQKTKGVIPGIADVMMRGGKSYRPDAIICTDESLVTDLVKSLNDHGIQPSTDVEIITQTFYPWSQTRMRSVQRLGYDLRAALNSCYSHIAMQRNGEATTKVIKLAPEFQDDRETKKKRVRKITDK